MTRSTSRVRYPRGGTQATGGCQRVRFGKSETEEGRKKMAGEGGSALRRCRVKTRRRSETRAEKDGRDRYGGKGKPEMTGDREVRVIQADKKH